MLKFRFPTARRPGPSSSSSSSATQNQNQNQPGDQPSSGSESLKDKDKDCQPWSESECGPSSSAYQSSSTTQSSNQPQPLKAKPTDSAIPTSTSSSTPTPTPNSTSTSTPTSTPTPISTPTPTPAELNHHSRPKPSSNSIAHPHSQPSILSSSLLNLPSQPAPAEPNSLNPLTMVSRKTRRKSYGGLRAMLGITRPDDPPPLPTAHSQASFDHHLPPHSHPPPTSHLLLSNLRNHKGPQPSLDESSPNSSLLSFPPPSPNPYSITAQDSRPSTSSLRPFPFLGGIRRKSANSNANKPALQPVHHLQQRPQSPNSSPQVSPAVSSQLESCARRVYTHGSSKKAQSVDDLSQFGLLPKPRLHPRRSEELFELRAQGPKSSAPPPSSQELARARQPDGGLHHGLDAIGALAGSLAGIKGTNSRADDRQPRLSNPKAMRTVYGVPIEDLFWRDGDAFPLLVDVLVDLIEDKGIDMQGIYRVPGEKRVIENLQASIDERGVRGVNIWKESYGDVHNLSGLLKLFLREIPGGVVPFDRYDAFLGVNGLEGEEARTKLLQSHVCDLPLPNKVLLVKLVRHFGRVVAHAESNSMLAHNVAIVFAPSLFRSGSEHSNPLLSMQNIGKASAVVRHLVVHAEEVFGSELLASAASRSSAGKAEGNHRESVEEEAGGGQGNGNGGTAAGGGKKKKKGGGKGKNRQSIGNAPVGAGGIACLGGAGKKKGVK